MGTFLSKRRIKEIGVERHVTESNVANTLGFTLWSLFPSELGSYFS